jgi:hypothetical protein
VYQFPVENFPLWLVVYRELKLLLREVMTIEIGRGSVVWERDKNTPERTWEVYCRAAEQSG